jgi:hypothetical protein
MRPNDVQLIVRVLLRDNSEEARAWLIDEQELNPTAVDLIAKEIKEFNDAPDKRA